jgi:hypothetical protein
MKPRRAAFYKAVEGLPQSARLNHLLDAAANEAARQGDAALARLLYLVQESDDREWIDGKGGPLARAEASARRRRGSWATGYGAKPQIVVRELHALVAKLPPRMTAAHASRFVAAFCLKLELAHADLSLRPIAKPNKAEMTKALVDANEDGRSRTFVTDRRFRSLLRAWGVASSRVESLSKRL